MLGTRQCWVDASSLPRPLPRLLPDGKPLAFYFLSPLVLKSWSADLGLCVSLSLDIGSCPSPSGHHFLPSSWLEEEALGGVSPESGGRAGGAVSLQGGKCEPQERELEARPPAGRSHWELGKVTRTAESSKEWSWTTCDRVTWGGGVTAGSWASPPKSPSDWSWCLAPEVCIWTSALVSDAY